MPNSFFRFKQFTIHQQQAGLKVSTDSCLFGAWCARQLQEMNQQPETILDIGTGTGLLLLMLAQQSTAMLEGVELDQPSFEQAVENIEQSAWQNRIRLFHQDIRTFDPGKTYDFIVSNPPFYEGSLRSGTQQRNVALHDEGLRLEELLGAVHRLLSASGSFAVLLPFQRAGECIRKASAHQLHLSQRLDVRQTPKHDFFRSLLLFSTAEQLLSKDELTIKTEADAYSPEFVELLKDYYLHL